MFADFVLEEASIEVLTIDEDEGSISAWVSWSEP